jgi:hypothetical protein
MILILLVVYSAVLINSDYTINSLKCESPEGSDLFSYCNLSDNRMYYELCFLQGLEHIMVRTLDLATNIQLTFPRSTRHLPEQRLKENTGMSSKLKISTGAL